MASKAGNKPRVRGKGKGHLKSPSGAVRLRVEAPKLDLEPEHVVDRAWEPLSLWTGAKLKGKKRCSLRANRWWVPASPIRSQFAQRSNVELASDDRSPARYLASCCHTSQGTCATVVGSFTRAAGQFVWPSSRDPGPDSNEQEAPQREAAGDRLRHMKL